ncbi:MAG: nucleoside triphosphate pyrophosphohydrolase, partial [Caldilineales bacterium]|nr:nucleoside triphosphate pyrophosphohydrolase [Caldilineales bacterium]
RQRLTQVEEAAAARGRALLDLPAAEQRALWQAAT